MCAGVVSRVLFNHFLRLLQPDTKVNADEDINKRSADI